MAAGCGTNHAAADYQSFVDSSLETYCQAIQTCCGPAKLPSVAACVANLKANALVLPPQVTSQELTDGIVVFDAAESAKCLAHIQTTLASCDNPVDSSIIAALLCHDAVHGTLPIGAACSYRDSQYECVPGAECSTTPPDSTRWWLGTCVPFSVTPVPPPASQGAACSDAYDCASLNCQNGICAAPLTATQNLCQ
jgi:hypothetical protein